MKPEKFRRWTVHIRHLSDVSVSENGYKTMSNLCKYVCMQFFYKSSRFKQIIFNKYANNLKMIISHRNLIISGLLLLELFNFCFAFLIHIIDNIITHSPYSLYYVTGNFSQWQCEVSLSRDTDGNHVTSILHCHWLMFWWRNTDYKG